MSTTGKKRRVAGGTTGGGTSSDSSTKGSNNSKSKSNKGMSAVQVGSITPEQLAAATGMSPEAAASYLASTAINGGSVKISSSNSSKNSNSGVGGGSVSKPEVKISFGPSRPPSSYENGSSGGGISSIGVTTTTTGAAAPKGGGADRSSGNNNSFTTTTTNLGEVDLETLKERAAAAMASTASSTGAFSNKHGLPCTEAEMKALMGMFVEVMGMSMTGSGSSSAGGKAASGSSDGSGDNNMYGSGDGPVFTMPNSSDGSGTVPATFSATGSYNTSNGTSIPITSEQIASMFSDGAAWEALRRTFSAAGPMMNGSTAPSSSAYEYTYDNNNNNNDMFDQDDNDDDDNYDESLDGEPDRELTLEEVEFLLQRRKQQADATNLSKKISASDWESLEQGAASEYQMQLEDRERQAEKKREKKQRKKAKQKEEAALKAAVEAQKKQEKAIVSWRSRIVSACQSNEAAKVETMLQESPLRRLPVQEKAQLASYSSRQVTSHLEFLLPNVNAKNRSHVERSVESRMLLADFVLGMELPLAFKTMRSGRTAFHTACFFGDVRLARLVIEKIESYKPSNGQGELPDDYLNMTCDESGWSPLHYGALSGSNELLELLLENGSNLSKVTDATHTWRDSDGLGVTPLELVDCVIQSKHEKEIETHGVALLDVSNSFLNQNQERRTYMKYLEQVQQRLISVEKNGYTPPPPPPSSPAKTETVSDPNHHSSSNDSTSSPVEEATTSKKSRQRKKKKKKKNDKGLQSDSNSNEGTNNNDNGGNAPASKSALPKTVNEVDPLIVALQGMGFTNNQISAAVKACGGTHRATADDLVTWILTQETGATNDVDDVPATTTPSQVQQHNEVRWEQVSKDVDSEITDLTFEKDQKEQSSKEQQEEAARRLAAKREEARRRNREWNNREQARQEQEARAKVAQKAIAAVQQSTVVTPTPTVPGLGLPKPGMVTGSYPLSQPTTTVPSHAFSSQAPASSNQTEDETSTRKWEPSTQSQLPVKPLPPSSQVTGRSISGPPSFVNPTPIWNASQPQQSHAAFVSFPQSNDDDRTVSSFGSNRGLSVSSKEFVPTSFSGSSVTPAPPVPPPGFMSLHTSASSLTMPPRPPVATVPEHSSKVTFVQDDQSQGEIRATAKAFVPTAYGPSSASPIPAARPDDFGVPGSSLLPQSRSQPQQHQGLGIANQLPQSMPAQSRGVSSLLGPGFSSNLDTMPSMTPVSEDSASAGTSLAGFLASTNSADDLPMSIALGGLGSSNLDNPIHASSANGSSLLGAISRGSSVNGPSIWGGASQDDVVPSLGNPLQASFFDANPGLSNNIETLEPNTSSKPLTWSGSADLRGAGHTQSGGSIW